MQAKDKLEFHFFFEDETKLKLITERYLGHFLNYGLHLIEKDRITHIYDEIIDAYFIEHGFKRNSYRKDSTSAGLKVEYENINQTVKITHGTIFAFFYVSLESRGVLISDYDSIRYSNEENFKRKLLNTLDLIGVDF